jgi:hypothetical protein
LIKKAYNTVLENGLLVIKMRRWLEGPYSLDKQSTEIEIKGTQKAGSTMTP